jgi:2-dehydropantoate 2-reductase
MHLAVIGAGALGRVYGVRLAASNAARVSFVVRGGQERSAAPLVIQREGEARVQFIEAPARVDRVPADADLALLAVRADNLDERLERLLLEAPPVPVVSLTCLMPSRLARVRVACAGTLVPAMPGVVAHGPARDPVRYWLPRSAPTLIDDAAASDPRVGDLVRALHAGEVPVRLGQSVAAVAQATSILFWPLVLLLDASGGTAEAAVAGSGRLRLAFEALRESRVLAPAVGAAAPWAQRFARYSRPRLLRIGVALARRSQPEAVRFVEQHFGNKMHAENVLVGEQIVALGRDKGIGMQAFEALLDECRRRKGS